MLKSIREEVFILFKSVPGYIVALFCVSVVAMNLLANKSIDGLPEWLALDCGFLLSWLSFLCMDTVTKHFGPKASVYLTIFALLVNLLMAIVFAVAALIPGVWSAYFDYEADIINIALDTTFRGTWYILLGSTIAFLLASFVNSFSNHGLRYIFKGDTFKAFAARSYISTAVGQFVDNLVFALIVSHTFFGWSLLQCITCAITGMVIELLCEVVFSPLGYKICKRWKDHNVGSEYVSKYYNN